MVDRRIGSLQKAEMECCGRNLEHARFEVFTAMKFLVTVGYHISARHDNPEDHDFNLQHLMI
jgi:hypothetical protein